VLPKVAIPELMLTPSSNKQPPPNDSPIVPTLVVDPISFDTCDEPGVEHGFEC
jgi:hypothetical protein